MPKTARAAARPPAVKSPADAAATPSFIDELAKVFAGNPFNSVKEDRLLYRLTAMNHAMLFTGVDEVQGRPAKWRVENSWGDKGEGKGFYVMNDSWFDEHMFEIAARRSRLPAALRAALLQPPLVLPARDPMGSLAV
jgi:bleomycin hydrolase